MNKHSKIYVAGHRGLVGSALLIKLKSEGYSNIITYTHSELDLTRQFNVERFFKNEQPEYIFLAAAKVGGILANYAYPADFIYSNLIIQTNVIHSAYKFKVKKLLFLGSSCIYPKHSPQPIKEEQLLTGKLEYTNEPYAVAKIAGIIMCQSYNRQFGTNFISVMPTNLYGPNDNFDLETSHVLPALIGKFHEAKTSVQQTNAKVPSISNTPAVVLWGTGSAKREFLYVDDLADACVFLIKNYSKSEIINIGTGKDISIKDLSDLIKEIVGFKGSIVWDSQKPDGTPQKLLSVNKINALGWAAKTSLQEGIRATYEWYINSQKSY